MTKELRISIGSGLACVAVLLLIFAPGCTKVPNGGVPIYLQVDSPSVAYDGGAFGSPGFRIPDAWVESGATDLGAYEMPIRVPILAQGDVSILISAGIYDNGIISSRASYPFYRSDTFTIHNAVPGQVYTRHPVYHYFANTQHGILENFNSSTSFDSHMSISNEDADSLPGLPLHSGQIVMGTNDTMTVCLQANGTTVNTNGREAYVEMNFKKSNTNENMPFDVGLAATDGTGTISYYPLITIFPQTSWKKTYLNFSSFIGNNAGSSFKIYYVVYKNPGITGTVYFDNVKLLYFN
ncbi:MAG: hypothetical protein JWO03_1519 [Bacteroidetes bacterium]|nr:hypothetical protein [Bacteroidota bacterium]